MNSMNNHDGWITDLFRDARNVERKGDTDQRTGRPRLTGRHCKARLERAKARRAKGRVKANIRHREGRKTFTP